MPRAVNTNQIVSATGKPLDAVDRKSLKTMGTPSNVRPDNDNRSTDTPTKVRPPSVSPPEKAVSPPSARKSKRRKSGSPTTDTGSRSESDRDPLLDALINNPNPAIDGIMSDGKNTMLSDVLTVDQKMENYRENVENYLIATRDPASKGEADTYLKQAAQGVIQLTNGGIETVNKLTGSELKKFENYSGEGFLQSVIAYGGLPYYVMAGIGTGVAATTLALTAPVTLTLGATTTGLAALATAFSKAGFTREQLEGEDLSIVQIGEMLGIDAVKKLEMIEEGELDNMSTYEKINKLFQIELAEIALGFGIGKGLSASAKGVKAVAKSKTVRKFLKDESGGIGRGSQRLRERRLLAKKKKEVRAAAKRIETAEQEIAEDSIKRIPIITQPSPDEVKALAKMNASKDIAREKRLAIQNKETLRELQKKYPPPIPRGKAPTRKTQRPTVAKEGTEETTKKLVPTKEARTRAGFIDKMNKLGNTAVRRGSTESVGEFISTLTNWMKDPQNFAGTTTLLEVQAKGVKRDPKVLEQTGSFVENLMQLKHRMLQKKYETMMGEGTLRDLKVFDDAIKAIDASIGEIGTEAGGNLQRLRQYSRTSWREKAQEFYDALDGHAAMLKRTTDPTERAALKKQMKKLVEDNRITESLEVKNAVRGKESQLGPKMNVAINAFRDNALANSALLNAGFGTIFNYSLEGIRNLRVNPKETIPVVISLPWTGLKNVVKFLGDSKTWKDLQDELLHGSKDFRFEGGVINKDSPKWLKLTNAVSTLNSMALRMVDLTLESTYKDFAALFALRQTERNMLKNDVAESIISRVMQEIKVGNLDNVPLEYKSYYKEQARLYHDAAQFRLPGPAAEVFDRGTVTPIGKLGWLLDGIARKIRNQHNPFASGVGHVMTMFSRSAANSFDWVGRNTIFGLLDTPPRAWNRIKTDHVRMTTGTLAMLGITMKSFEPDKSDPHYSSNMKSSISYNQAGGIKGVHFGDQFVDLRRIGGVGHALELANIMNITVHRMMAAGDKASALDYVSRLTEAFGASLSNTWLQMGLVQFVKTLQDPTISNVEALKRLASMTIPGAGLTARVKTAVSGERVASTYILDLLSGDYKGQSMIGIFGRPFSQKSLVSMSAESDELNYEDMANPLLYFDARSRMPTTKESKFHKFMLMTGGYFNGKEVYLETGKGIESVRKSDLTKDETSYLFKILRPPMKMIGVKSGPSIQASYNDWNASLVAMSFNKERFDEVLDRWKDQYDSIETGENAFNDLMNEVESGKATPDMRARVQSMAKRVQLAKEHITTRIEYLKTIRKRKDYFDGFRDQFRGVVPDKLRNDNRAGIFDFLVDMSRVTRSQLKDPAKSKSRYAFKEMIVDYEAAYIKWLKKAGRPIFKDDEKYVKRYAFELAKKNAIIDMYNSFTRAAKSRTDIPLFIQTIYLSPSVVEEQVRRILETPSGGDQ